MIIDPIYFILILRKRGPLGIGITSCLIESLKYIEVGIQNMCFSTETFV